MVVFLAGISGCPSFPSSNCMYPSKVACSLRANTIGKTFASVKRPLAHWQPHIERAAFPIRPVLCPDEAFMQLDDTLANGQSQTETIDFSRESCIDTMKTV